MGGTGSYQSSPTYHVDEGGIVTVGLRAPRTKGGFRMLKTKVVEIFRRRREILPPAGSFVSSFN